MRYPSLLYFLAVPVAVIACEGECITGVTDAWITHYHPRINAVFNQLAPMVGSLFPENARPTSADATKYLEPLLSAYSQSATPALTKAIFPGHFHGKCLGVDGKTVPPGCPNPDCPVVCGTPGSLVHFFPTLREIVYDTLRNETRKATAPGGEAYRKVEKRIVQDVAHATRPEGRRADLSSNKRMRRMRRSMLEAEKRAAENVKNQLRAILSRAGPLLEKECGPAYKQCSWEEEMKKFILTFP